jgi:hypothetical protein
MENDLKESFIILKGWKYAHYRSLAFNRSCYIRPIDHAGIIEGTRIRPPCYTLEAAYQMEMGNSSEFKECDSNAFTLILMQWELGK